MTATLNASTSTGVILTSDTSGSLAIQSNGTTIATASSTGFYAPGGVVQVVSTTTTAPFSTTSGSYVDITGLTVTITPKSSTSKILVFTSFYAGSDVSPYPKFQLLRNGSQIFIGDTYGSATRQSAGMVTGTPTANTIQPVTALYLDSPATTSATTYKWQVYCYSSRAIYIGSSQGSADLNNASVPSTITVMEIAA